jgi:hypothetical protein
MENILLYVLPVGTGTDSYFLCLISHTPDRECPPNGRVTPSDKRCSREQITLTSNQSWSNFSELQCSVSCSCALSSGSCPQLVLSVMRLYCAKEQLRTIIVVCRAVVLGQVVAAHNYCVSCGCTVPRSNCAQVVLCVTRLCWSKWQLPTISVVCHAVVLCQGTIAHN